MGLKSSPYNSVQGMMVGQEVILGAKDDRKNVFRWDQVVMNCPGAAEYNPVMPWVYKARRDGTLAADVLTYVDDNRPTGPTESECWKAAQRISGTLAWLGIQDAARKRRLASREPGPWAGSVVHISEQAVCTLLPQDKWDRAKTILQWVESELDSPDGKIEFKRLESERGFLIYALRGYPALKPYLKGFHATLDSWRSGRDTFGWKVKKKKEDEHLEDLEDGGFDQGADEAEFKLMQDEDLADELASDSWSGESGTKAPRRVTMVFRLRSDVQALQLLMAFERPVKRIIRRRQLIQVSYGFGDASGKGFGSCILINGKVHWKGGQWIGSISEETSNYRELRNLVDALEEAVPSGVIDGPELFMFTDNSVAERAYFRGTSSSRLLFELIVRLRNVEMQAGCTIFLVHVSGLRMVASGTDGVSRGVFNAGVMMEQPLLKFVPLHLSALERSPDLFKWVSSWAEDALGRSKVSVVGPDQWPLEHPTGGTYIWFPPPAGAQVAVEWLTQSIHKRPYSTHIFVCPRTMSAWWYKVVNKACDIMLNLYIGAEPCWSKDQFEPLTLAVYMPLSRRFPWRHKGTKHVCRVQGDLQRMWKAGHQGSGPVLRELLSRARGRACIVGWEISIISIWKFRLKS